MRALPLLALAAGLLLTGCDDSPRTERPVNVQAISLANGVGRCIPGSDMGVYAGSEEVTGELRSRLLTPDAKTAGVRIFRKGQDVTNFGQQTLFYTNSKADCVMWMESIALQEYGQRLGLNPLSVSPFYEPDKTKSPIPPVQVSPAPQVTPTPEPTASASPQPTATPTEQPA